MDRNVGCPVHLGRWTQGRHDTRRRRNQFRLLVLRRRRGRSNQSGHLWKHEVLVKPRDVAVKPRYVDSNTGTGGTPHPISWSLIAGFLAAGLHEAVSYVLVQPTCAHDHKSLTHITT